MKINNIIRQAVRLVPSVMPHLSDKARWMVYTSEPYKTADYMLTQIERLVSSVYSGYIGGQFIDTMANLISGQLTQAYRQAYRDEGFTDYVLPDYLEQSLEEMILNQYNFVDQYYRDIVDARVDGSSIDPLLARAQLWANRWTEAYNEAVRLITINGGGNLEWVYGDTDHCDTCMSLNGIVARASEWDMLGVKPQSAPNNKLQCGGWKCQCRLEPTKKRRSPNAYGRIEEILLAKKSVNFDILDEVDKKYLIVVSDALNNGAKLIQETERAIQEAERQ